VLPPHLPSLTAPLAPNKQQVRALQRRLYELGHANLPSAPSTRCGTANKDGGGGGGPEEWDPLCLEADLHRLLAHSRKVADEMRQYGQVRKGLMGSGWVGRWVVKWVVGVVGAPPTFPILPAKHRRR